MAPILPTEYHQRYDHWVAPIAPPQLRRPNCAPRQILRPGTIIGWPQLRPQAATGRKSSPKNRKSTAKALPIDWRERKRWTEKMDGPSPCPNPSNPSEKMDGKDGWPQSCPFVGRAVCAILTNQIAVLVLQSPGVVNRVGAVVFAEYLFEVVQVRGDGRVVFFRDPLIAAVVGERDRRAGVVLVILAFCRREIGFSFDSNRFTVFAGPLHPTGSSRLLAGQ